MKRQISVSIHTLIAIFVAVIYGLVYTLSIVIGKNTNLYFVSLLGLLLLIYVCLSWKRTYYRFFSPYIVVFITLFLTLCGQALVWAFGLDAGYRDLRYVAYYAVRFSNDGIARALLFSYVCICVMHVVVINSVSSRTRKTKEKKVHNKKQEDMEQANRITNTMDKNLYHIIAVFGLALILMSMPFYVISNFSQYLVIKAAGYGAQYENVSYGISSIGGKIGDFFPVGVITLLFAWGKRNVFNRCNYGVKATVAYLLVATYLFMELRLSQRTGVMLFAIAIVFVFYTNKKMPQKLCFLLIVVGLAAMVAMRMIDLLRRGYIYDLSDFIAYAMDEENNAVLDFLGDIGWNLMTTVKFQEVIPDIRNYGFGASYLISLTSIIPNLNFWDVHPAYRYGNISVWLQSYLGMSFGIGCTPVAEAYYNFGHMGFFVFIIWGMLTVSLNRKFDAPKSALDHYHIVLFMGLLLKSFVRSSFFAVFRPYIYYVLMPTMIIKVIYLKMGRRGT